jgi:type IV secretion system protein VirB5
LIAAVLVARGACAAIPVVDFASIAQLVQQLQTMAQQLTTLQNHLAQAREAYAAITGPRGMETLLEGTVRNYLPPDWQGMVSMLQSTSAQYRALSESLQQIIRRESYLTPAALAALTPAARAEVEEARQSIAATQLIAEQALAESSARFASLQQLIDAIPRATDEKGVLDLQARIQVEQGMLANEHTKLSLALQAAQAAEQARVQRNRERAVEGLGLLRTLPPMGL